MRTQKQLNSREFQDDMSELKKLLDEAKIEYIFEKHMGATPKVKKLIGYYPTGEWHLMVGKNSIIRGMVSFGDYEILGEKDDDPIKFSTAKEMFEEIKNRLK